MKISTRFGGPTYVSYQVTSKRVRKTPQKRKKREIPCQSDIPISSLKKRAFPFYVSSDCPPSFKFQADHGFWIQISKGARFWIQISKCFRFWFSDGRPLLMAD